MSREPASVVLKRIRDTVQRMTPYELAIRALVDLREYFQAVARLSPAEVAWFLSEDDMQAEMQEFNLYAMTLDALPFTLARCGYGAWAEVEAAYLQRLGKRLRGILHTHQARNLGGYPLESDLVYEMDAREVVDTATLLAIHVDRLLQALDQAPPQGPVRHREKDFDSFFS